MDRFYVVEKANSLAVHAICSTAERAQRWISVNAREYSAKGYFMDETLTPDSFIVVTQLQKGATCAKPPIDIFRGEDVFGL
jgi:hypothetical protein